jgi:hypothetical protein
VKVTLYKSFGQKVFCSGGAVTSYPHSACVATEVQLSLSSGSLNVRAGSLGPPFHMAEAGHNPGNQMHQGPVQEGQKQADLSSHARL